MWLDHSPKRMWVLAFVLGAILALGQAPVSLPIGVFISIPILGYCGFHTQTKKQAFGIGWWAAFGYFVFGLIWLVEPFFVEPEKHAILAPFALAMMSGGLALFWGAAFAVAKIWGESLMRYSIGLAVAFVCAEYLRSVLFTGFPWGLLSYMWINTPVAQAAAFIGPYGLTFVTLLGGLLMLSFAKHRFMGPIISICFVGIFAVMGAYRLSVVSEMSETRVRLVQPNAPQHQKWHPEWKPVFFRRGLEFTQAKADKPIDLVVWPETSVHFLFENNTADLGILSNYAGPNAHIIAGIQRAQFNAQTQRDQYYNSSVHLDPRGGLLSTYDKSHLVPFGEYVPFSEYLSEYGFRGLAQTIGGFSTGEGLRVVKTQGLPSYMPMICYEAIFPMAINGHPERPEFLLHMTNDAWFGDYIGPYQHLVQVQFRAIEQGLPVARSANTGVSAMIDPYGRILDQLELNKKGFLDANLPKPLNPTVYSQYGELPVLILLLLLGLGAKYVTFRPNLRQHDQ
ncbi:apolipoprotein N-acyltransferase [Amylibacter sp. SFDW26]|uniref:apolipoprotein N-acyltransferase n=1 Tax=Amylibacter sp. SFDW26 TaxID=2652722 RepID=UPI001261F5AA|nr:apolipoprotein N-acyltransferase [Amylibacter sp. SFDW26]KAB7613355.1 apolipoprotein N-acyltransferase [Amylibacter sp. SFDW26]